MNPPDGDVVLVLRPVADPQARKGHPERDPTYRLRLALKAMLRAFGWKCVSMTNASGANGKIADSDVTR
jgi:hypothetical protein